MGNHIGKKFNIRPQTEKSKLIMNYEDFADAQPGNFLGLFVGGKYNSLDNTLTTFFEKTIPIKDQKDKQRVFLQHHERTNSDLYDGKKPIVVEYKLPLKGRISLEDFQKGKVKTYLVNK